MQPKRAFMELGTQKVMKSTIQKMHKEIERLTADQRELCRVCYQKIEKQPIPFGLSIMIRLFSNHPQYKDIWPQFKQIPDSSLMHAPELRRHARIYMAGLRLIINSMNDDDKLETALRGIAQAHVKWHIHKYHLINMLPCVIESFQAKFPMNVDQVQAWTTLFDVIANLIDIFRSH
ncbi:Globin family and Globin-like domain and Globin, structural domain-containing protein [Aphelenchoides bicaudatus]|nr:Globin family and Globin-like domain and Globin, structural domain-containing protein [Aphelenchoides bicaudatus]